jgi:ketosteroid isomerase-like protein
VSEENVEVVRRAIALRDAGDWNALPPLLDPEVEFRDAAQVFDVAEVLRGITEVRRAWDEWDAAWPSFTTKVEQCIDLDPWVLCELSWRAEARYTGIPVEREREVHAVEVRDGRITRVWVYDDLDTARGAIEGLE